MVKKFFVGVDIGGTKMAAALVSPSGRIITREKIPTSPRTTTAAIFENVVSLIQDVLHDNQITAKNLGGIGVGIPGIVDIDQSKILAAPNINLAGLSISQRLAKIFHTKVAAGNDVNLGLLGEQWLGAAKNIDHVIGLFPGTGIGGAIIINGQLILGNQGAAAELGHMIMEINGPKCTCGNEGCLEALASRWAIERDIRAAIKKGKKTILAKKINSDKPIKSRLINEALKARDPLVTKLITKASLVLGQACVSLAHIFNPQAIVFGGGVIEACGEFMLPIIRQTAYADPFFKKLKRCTIVESKLKDDAVILGAVALIISRNNQ